MKYITTLSLALVLFLMKPYAVLASTTGSGLGGSLQLVSIGQSIVDFLTGPIALILITLGILASGITIIKSKRNDDKGWSRLGNAIIGGSIILAASSLVSFFFSGALI